MTRRPPGRRRSRAGVSALAAWLALALPAPACAAWFEYVGMGSRTIGLGPSSLADVDDVSAVHWNPARLPASVRGQALFEFANPYGIEGLSEASIALGRAWRGTTFAAAWHQLGIRDAYAEQQFSLGAGRTVARVLRGSLAAGATYKLQRIAFQAQTDAFTGAAVDFGSQAKGSLDLALHWAGPWRFDVAYVARDLLEPTFQFVPGSGGGTVAASQHLAAALRWNPESVLTFGWTHPGGGLPASWSAGLELRFYDVFAVRSGFQNLSQVWDSRGSPNDLQYTGGVGIFHRGVRVDAAVVSDHDLGATYRATVLVPLGGPEPR